MRNQSNRTPLHDSGSHCKSRTLAGILGPILEPLATRLGCIISLKDHISEEMTNVNQLSSQLEKAVPFSAWTLTYLFIHLDCSVCFHLVAGVFCFCVLLFLWYLCWSPCFRRVSRLGVRDSWRLFEYSQWCSTSGWSSWFLDCLLSCPSILCRRYGRCLFPL